MATELGYLSISSSKPESPPETNKNSHTSSENPFQSFNPFLIQQDVNSTKSGSRHSASNHHTAPHNHNNHNYHSGSGNRNYSTAATSRFNFQPTTSPNFLNEQNLSTSNWFVFGGGEGTKTITSSNDGKETDKETDEDEDVKTELFVLNRSNPSQKEQRSSLKALNYFLDPLAEIKRLQPE
jgi:hypothetical protein